MFCDPIGVRLARPAGRATATSRGTCETPCWFRGRRSSRQDQQVGVAHGDARAARLAPPPDAGARRSRHRRPARAPARTRRRPTRRATPPRGRPRPAPSRQGLGRTRTSAPSRAEPLDGGRDGIRAEQAAAYRHAALVGVECGRHAGVERIRRGQVDATDDGQRQQRRASGCRADVDQPGQLVPRSSGRAAPRR